jgi:hypothetical protein
MVHQGRQRHHERCAANKTILPHTMAYGILFYRVEALHARHLQLYLVETDTGRSHRLVFAFFSRQKKS